MYHQLHLRKTELDRAAAFKLPMDVVEATGIPAREKLCIPKA